MISEDNIKNLLLLSFVVFLVIFFFMLIKPLFIPIVAGAILAYIFFPFNSFLISKIKNKTIASLITCFLVISVIFFVLWFSLPILAKQVFDAYLMVQSFNLIAFLKQSFPFLFSSEQIYNTFSSAYNSFLINLAKHGSQSITNVLLDLPSLVLKFLVVLVVFFYGLRDGKDFLEFAKDTIPFSKQTIQRFIKKAKDITFSVVYGRLVIGILVGIIAGIGFYFAGVSNVLLLTFFAIITSIIPIIGPWIIWIPVTIGLLIQGKFYNALFLFVYSSIAVTLFENLAHLLFVSKKSDIPTPFTLISMIGGMFLFGILGIIIGPLIISYLLILVDIYRENRTKSE